MKLLVNCDQVFEVLTRGPFPTGEPTDDAVELHLAACHECRQMAEALRPAVALLHEAVSKEEALELPEYQGSLPEPDPFENDDVRPLRLGLRMLDRRPPRAITYSARPSRRSEFDAGTWLNAARLVAASVLIVSLGWLAWGVAISPRHPGGASAMTPAARPFAPVQLAPISLDRQGLITLAAFNLPDSCFPPALRGAGEAENNTLVAAAAEAVQCCSECHSRIGSASHARAVGDARFTLACAVCHRG